MIKFGTKAQTLKFISQYHSNFFIPEFEFFTYSSWKSNKKNIIDKLLNKFKGNLLAIRSSSIKEDSLLNSMAGIYDSELNVKANLKSLGMSIDKVFASYKKNLSENDQVIVQKMVQNVVISGVAMTRNLQDGAPYYTISYDDLTGRTDTVTSGSQIHKTVLVHRLCPDVVIMSQRVRAVLRLIREIESVVGLAKPVDIEFALDKNFIPHLLQVRPITKIDSWKKEIDTNVNSAIENAQETIKVLKNNDFNLIGEKTIYANMPDWNPAEIIGDIPRPLAAGLYRNLITKDTWSRARGKMGYKLVEGVDLMKMLAGHAFIDVRASLNSLLPETLDKNIAKKLVDQGITRLQENKDYHDKLEFELSITIHTLDFESEIKRIFPNLNTKDKKIFEKHLKSLTKAIVSTSERSSLVFAENTIKKLEQLQTERNLIIDKNMSEHIIINYISLLQTECKNFGTLPFAILARHGFIAQAFLRSFVSKGVLSKERCEELKSSIKTVAGELSTIMESVKNKKVSTQKFFKKFGHLRPGSYDILSDRYVDRKNLFKFEHDIKSYQKTKSEFSFSNIEAKGVEKALKGSGINSLTADKFYDYIYRATSGREWGKLVFTKHLSDIIELIAVLGKRSNLSREDLSFINFESFLDLSFDRGVENIEIFMDQKARSARKIWEIHSSVFLPHLISCSEDLSIIPIQKGTPNFITQISVKSEIIIVTAKNLEELNIENKIVCIESADPGFDWIFSKKINGLITQYGGPNSHMAIRCTEFGLPAAIGVGKELFNRIKTINKIWLDCDKKSIELNY